MRVRTMIVLNNVQDNDVVHQRCLLISGRCEGLAGDEGHVEIATKDNCGRSTFPEQRWPMSHGVFKALAILAPGDNLIRIASGQNASQSIEANIRSICTLASDTPLHLAIMVAKDSPLLIDCPPGKFGALSGAHSSLDAAISKFRVAAYMWQALTAEEMRSNGLGRRSFRLEEEWSPDTMSRVFANEITMDSTAKIHLVRTDKTVAELRDVELAQQNPTASRDNELHEIFTDALLASGAPFTTEAKPVVAGLILDSHYDVKDKLIVAHAALGAHDANGLSLGIFGSHLTYSWPRFMEEIPDCLLDIRPPGDRVGNDNGECASMWEACSVGQGEFLHEVGHAFSAPHTSGIMSRGYSKDWPKCFLSKTAYSVQMQAEGVSPVTDKAPNDCHWDIRDLLRFRNLIHFHLPSDADLNCDSPSFDIQDEDNSPCISITSQAGIVQALLNGIAEAGPSLASPCKSIQFTLDDIESRFDYDDPLELEVITMNGRHRTWDLWHLFTHVTYFRVPGPGIRLIKKSVSSDNNQSNDWSWVVILKKISRDGSLVSTSKVYIPVGGGLNGAVVCYEDGTSARCGPRGKHDQDPYMGGHQAKKIAISKGAEITKVTVINTSGDYWDGLRLDMSNEKAMGLFNNSYGASVEVLVPEVGHTVVGFYGTSDSHGMCKEFGIVTAPKDQTLPDFVYDLQRPELQNRPACEPINQDSDTEDSESDTSEDENRENDISEDEDSESDSSEDEDEDEGYDNESDADDFPSHDLFRMHALQHK